MSIRLLRKSRAMIAAKPHPSDSAVKMMACGEPSPSEGSQCRWTARIRIRIRAALILILILAVHLHWLPSLGEGSPQAIILTALSLGWGFAAIIARLLRNNLIDIYQQPYLNVARAKGLS